MKTELEGKEPKPGDPADPPAPAAPVEPPPIEEKKPALLNVYAQVQLNCPLCGEVVISTDEGSTEDGTLELELTAENGYRAEIPRVDGECDACKAPVFREKIILFYHGKRPA